MYEKTKKQVKIFSIAFSVIVIILLIMAIFTVRMISFFEEMDDRISAKEGLELVMGINRYQPYANNITHISSRGLSNEGKADNWFFDFRVEINGSLNFFNVNIAKNGNCLLFDNQTGSIYNRYIKGWEMDSTEIIKICEDLDCVNDFYKDNRLLGARLIKMSFLTLDEYQSIGCIAVIYYFSGGGFSEFNEMWVYLDGTTGKFLESSYRGSFIP